MSSPIVPNVFRLNLYVPDFQSFQSGLLSAIGVDSFMSHLQDCYQTVCKKGWNVLSTASVHAWKREDTTRLCYDFYAVLNISHERDTRRYSQAYLLHRSNVYGPE
jgi:hypothetical protein